MNRTIVIVSIAGLSLLMLGTERTLGCILGSALGLVVNGMFTGKPGDATGKRPEESLSANKVDTNRDIGTDCWKTPELPAATD